MSLVRGAGEEERRDEKGEEGLTTSRSSKSGLEQELRNLSGLSTSSLSTEHRYGVHEDGLDDRLLFGDDGKEKSLLLDRRISFYVNSILPWSFGSP